MLWSLPGHSTLAFSSGIKGSDVPTTLPTSTAARPLKASANAYPADVARDVTKEVFPEGLDVSLDASLS